MTDVRVVVYGAITAGPRPGSLAVPEGAELTVSSRHSGRVLAGRSRIAGRAACTDTAAVYMVDVAEASGDASRDEYGGNGWIRAQIEIRDGMTLMCHTTAARDVPCRV
jgi:hypothetical protein